jgi:hypothetical protein
MHSVWWNERGTGTSSDDYAATDTTGWRSDETARSADDSRHHDAVTKSGRASGNTAANEPGCAARNRSYANTCAESVAR